MNPDANMRGSVVAAAMYMQAVFTTAAAMARQRTVVIAVAEAPLCIPGARVRGWVW
jgi:hypothetical protein